MRGWIAVPRAMFADDPLWTERRPRTKWEAWVDVVQMAASAPYEHVTDHGVIHLERGEVLLSLRFMAERWDWSVKLVRRWLASGPIRARLRAQRKAYDGTVYLVVNYDTYSLPARPKGTEKGTETGNDRAQRGHKIDNLDNSDNLSFWSSTESDPASGPDSGPESDPESDPEEPTSPALRKLPKRFADAAYTTWGERFGAVNYGRLRKALLACVDAGVPPERLADAVDGYADWQTTLSDRERQFNPPSPEILARDIRRWDRLGQMPLKANGDLTERGRLFFKNLPKEAFA